MNWTVEELHELALAIVAAEARGYVFVARRTLQRLERGELTMTGAACRLRALLGAVHEADLGGTAPAGGVDSDLGHARIVARASAARLPSEEGCGRVKGGGDSHRQWCRSLKRKGGRISP